MSRPTHKTIRWDDPNYSVRSSESSSHDTGSVGASGGSLSNTVITQTSPSLPIANVLGTVYQGSSTGKAQAVVTSTSWRELQTRDGKVYYYNSVTQKTVWDMPQEYRDYLEFARNSHKSSGSSSGFNSSTDETFWSILREKKVTSKWKWEEALRAIITHPDYKCIPTLQERKASFQRYCEAVRSVEEEEEKLQKLAIQESFKAMLAADTKITSNTKWTDVVNSHGRQAEFLAVPSNRERVQLFEEYQSELRRTELESVWQRRKAASSQIMFYLKELDLQLDLVRGVVPNWYDYKDRLIGMIEGVDPVEYLIAFEEFVHELEVEFQVKRKAEKEGEMMKEVELKRSYERLLDELEESGKLTALSTWSSTYTPHIKDRLEYRAFVQIYLYGSIPLDIFYDRLDRLQCDYEPIRAKIGAHLIKNYGTCEGSKLPKRLSFFSQFKEEFSAIFPSNLNFIQFAFEELFGSEAIETERTNINNYKHFLKHFYPPIQVHERWSDVKRMLSGKPEFEAVCEEIGEIYFLKFIKWLSKHEEEEGKEKIISESDRYHRTHHHNSHQNSSNSSLKRKHDHHRSPSPQPRGYRGDRDAHTHKTSSSSSSRSSNRW